MKTQEEIELKLRTNTQNYPGFVAPLTFRNLKNTDSAILTPVLKQHAKSIRGFLGQFQHADRWELKTAQKFVASCLRDEFPSSHYLFFIGNTLVGMGSLHQYGESFTDVQIVLAVFGKENQGKGIGTVIGMTLKYLAFEVWGHHSFWWIVDATNTASIKSAQKVGLTFDHSWEDEVKHSEQESGLWFAFSEKRPEGLAPGVLQGANIEYWAEAKTASLLEKVIALQNRSHPNT